LELAGRVEKRIIWFGEECVYQNLGKRAFAETFSPGKGRFGSCHSSVWKRVREGKYEFRSGFRYDALSLFDRINAASEIYLIEFWGKDFCGKVQPFVVVPRMVVGIFRYQGLRLSAVDRLSQCSEDRLKAIHN